MFIGELGIPSFHFKTDDLKVKMTPLMSGYTKRPLGKFVQYEIDDLYMYRPGLYVPDISDYSRTVFKFVKVVHVPATILLGRRSRNLYCTDICLAY